MYEGTVLLNDSKTLDDAKAKSNLSQKNEKFEEFILTKVIRLKV